KADSSDSLTAATAQNDVQDFLPSKSPNNFSGLLPTLLIIFITLGGLWLWLKSKKKKNKQQINGQIYTKIASQQLPGGQQLMVAKLNKEYWVMAFGVRQDVILLHRYNEQEWHGIEQQSPPEKNWKSTLLKKLNSPETQKN